MKSWVEVMVTDGTVALIPIRLVPSPKHRLAEVFDTRSRQQLTEAMLKDVLTAIKTTKGITKIIIVTNNQAASSILLPKGYTVFKTHSSNLNAELIEAANSLANQGWEWVIIVLADLPLLNDKILDQVILHGQMTKYSIIARDWRGTGTNILFTKLPLQFHIHFGHQSFRAHMEQLEKNNHQWMSFHALESALDIDDFEAIQKFMHLAVKNPEIQNTHTYQTLLALQSEVKKKEKSG
jgi:2-phospho-L-lactate guanylyltransferase